MNAVIRFTRLEDMPIEDPFHEKLVFEKGKSEREICPQRFPGPILVSADSIRQRVLEVYKRCLEESNADRREKVVCDFVAHFPQFSLDTPWLRELVSMPSAPPDTATDRKRKRIFLAIANGLRRAASTKKRPPAIQTFYRLQAARTAQIALSDELTGWNVGLERPLSTTEYIAERAALKAKELADTHLQLLRSDRERLGGLLQQGHCYEASVLIASKVFGVRARDLQRRAD